MKKLYFSCLLLFLLTLVEKSNAQIPNAGFDYWTNGNPDGWTVLYFPGVNFITKSSTAHAGASALKAEVLAYNGKNYAGLASAGNGYFACNCRPEALHFWYMFNPVGGESMEAESTSFQLGTYFGVGFFEEFDPVTTYKEGIIDFSYPTSGNADSISIIFRMNGYPNDSDFTLGTNFIVDDLSFGPSSTTGINHQSPAGENIVSLEQNSPNPASDKTNIIYSIPSVSLVSLDLFDMTGRKVKQVLNERQTPGRYKAIVDLSEVPAGNYFYRLNADSSILTKMLVVVK